MKTSAICVIAVCASLSFVSAFVPSQDRLSKKKTALHMEPSSRREMLLQSGLFGGALLVAAQPTFAASRPTYLTEPTEEFKESERQREEFRRAQIIVKQKMKGVLDRLTDEPNDEEAIVNDLKELKKLVTQTGGMPLGIKKDDLVKQVRAKKAKGYWPTNCEIAYQALINEIMFQQSPNKEKEEAF